MSSVEQLLDNPNAAAAGVPDLVQETSAIVSHARTADREIRTEILPNGEIRIYKKGEFRLPNGDLYVGETVDDKRHGRGTYTFVNGDAYVGEFEGGIYHGMGVLRKATFKESGRECVGRMYQGQWKTGYRHGKGRYADGFGNIYEGDFGDDAFSGRGAMMYADGRRYEGEWQKGLWHGQGVLIFPNGESYSGSFFRGMYHNEGMYRYGGNNGSYNGAWRLGRKHGIGKRIFASGAEYEGEYREGRACGRGLYRSALGDLFVGHMKDDKYHGDGTLITCTGDRYTGQFQKGMPCGVGRWEYERGGWYEGEFSAAVRTGVPYRPPPKPLLLQVDNEGKPTMAAIQASTAAGQEAKAKADKKSKPNVRKAKYGQGSKGDGTETKELGKYLLDPEKAKLLSFTSQMQEKEALRLKAGMLSKKLEDFFAPILVGSPDDRAYIAAGGDDEALVVPWPDGKRQGKGVRVWSNGARYEGEWLQDEMHGFGVYVGPGPGGNRYEGGWFNGRRHGRGVESYGNTDGQAYLCPLGNQHDGSSGRCVYDGEWQEGWMWGQGTFTCCDGRQYAGGWLKGKRHGKGRWIMLPARMLHYSTIRNADSGDVDVGKDVAGEFGAPVKLDDQARIRVYEGGFDQGQRHGKGKAIFNNGDMIEGEFVEGRPHGPIKMTFATGKISYATFMHGQRRMWITGPALEKLVAEERAAKEAEFLAKKRAAKGAALMTRVDLFGRNQKALEAKVAVEKAKGKEARAAAAGGAASGAGGGHHEDHEEDDS